jgi:dTDP-4-dehydrorhamnose 3,5-epimerase
MSTVVRELLPGCFELQPRVTSDARGRFVKPFQREMMQACGMHEPIEELYYSVSGEGVLRGLHLQVAPYGGVKLVLATEGSVVDVLLDLRAGSPTLRQHVAVELSAEAGNSVLVADGVAHGFCVPKGTATLLYAVTAPYAPDCDTGVRWDSAAITWAVRDPIVSARDAALPTLDEFLAQQAR